MRVDGVGPGLPGPPPGAAGDGLVVGEPRVRPGAAGPSPRADGDVVHRPLGGGRDPVGARLSQRPQQHVDDPLRGLHVPPRDRRRGPGVHERALRRLHPDRGGASGVRRDVLADQGPDHVVDGRQRDGPDRVDAALPLLRRPREVHLRLVAGHPHRRRDLRGAAAAAVVLHGVAEAVDAVGDPFQHRADGALGVGHELRHAPLQPAAPVAPGQAGEPLPAPGHRRELGAQVPGPLLRRPDVGQDHLPHPLPRLARLDQLHGRDHEPLLQELPGQRERAGRRPPDVGVVGPRRHVAHLPAVGEDRRHHRDVGQVGAPAVGVVEHGHVALAQLEALDARLHRQRHRPQVDGDVRRLGRHPRVGVEDGAGEVPALLDVRRVGGPPQHPAHLVGHRREEVPEDLEPDGVGGGVAGPPPVAAALTARAHPATSTTRSKCRSTRARSPRPRKRVVSSRTTTAGPSSRWPGRRSAPR